MDLLQLRRNWQKLARSNLPEKNLTCLLAKVLKLNNFTFDNHNFIQVKGTAMGTRAAPNLANVYMGRFEDTFCIPNGMVPLHN